MVGNISVHMSSQVEHKRKLLANYCCIHSGPCPKRGVRKDMATNKYNNVFPHKWSESSAYAGGTKFIGSYSMCLRRAIARYCTHLHRLITETGRLYSTATEYHVWIDCEKYQDIWPTQDNGSYTFFYHNNSIQESLHGLYQTLQAITFETTNLCINVKSLDYKALIENAPF